MRSFCAMTLFKQVWLPGQANHQGTKNMTISLTDPLLAVATLLCLATIYCRYHYVIDVLAGLLTVAVVIPIGNWLYWRFAPKAD